MDSIISYQIFYTESAVRDIEEKFDYIAQQLRDPGLAQGWYLRLRATIQDALTTFPCKYACYDAAPWKEKGIRLFLLRNDVVLYSVDEATQTVSIHSVCTHGRDLSAHLSDLIH